MNKKRIPIAAILACLGEVAIINAREKAPNLGNYIQMERNHWRSKPYGKEARRRQRRGARA